MGEGEMRENNEEAVWDPAASCFMSSPPLIPNGNTFTEMPDYTEAMGLTMHAINKRAANHRNVVIGTSWGFIITLLMTIANQAISHVTILTIFILLSGVFFIE